MRGFYWTANSPYIQGMWVRGRRAPRAPGLSDDYTTGFIQTPLPSGRVHYNANPAYMVYECLTNQEWGMGGSIQDLDISEFQKMAVTLLNENFGLFMLWSKQDSIENFIGDILDHIQAVLFLHPKTGLLTPKLLRADYNVNDLPRFNVNNCKIDDFDRKTWGETVNEVVATWTNPETEKPETVTMQDLANIVQQNGQIVSSPKNYYGIRTAALALKVAARDLRLSCAPLTTCSLKADRRAFDLTPGSCLVLDWPEEDVEGVVYRVQTVDYGNTTDGTVTATLLEDIFSLYSPVYSGSQGSGWSAPSQDPNTPANLLLTTAPAFVIANSADQFVEQPSGVEVNTLMLVADPNLDFLNYEPFTNVTLANGSVVPQSVGTGQRTPYGTLPGALPAEVSSTVTAFNNVSGRKAQLADLAFIGTGEVALVQAVATDGTYTLARGVLDTVPQAWPAGTPVWFVNNDAVVLDTTARAPGETVDYRLLMRTSRGLLAYDGAPTSSVTLTQRPYRPLRPANVKVNGVGFGTVVLSGGSAAVSWSTRNRLLETSQVLGWAAGSVTPETGQTTTIEVLGTGGTVLHTYSGLTGSSYTVPAADLVGGNRIRVSSMRDGLRSFQSFDMAYTA